MTLAESAEDAESGSAETIFGGFRLAISLINLLQDECF